LVLAAGTGNTRACSSSDTVIRSPFWMRSNAFSRRARASAARCARFASASWRGLLRLGLRHRFRSGLVLEVLLVRREHLVGQRLALGHGILPMLCGDDSASSNPFPNPNPDEPGPVHRGLAGLLQSTRGSPTAAPLPLSPLACAPISGGLEGLWCVGICDRGWSTCVRACSSTLTFKNPHAVRADVICCGPGRR
jgi:hypothetical protein